MTCLPGSWTDKVQAPLLSSLFLSSSQFVERLCLPWHRALISLSFWWPVDDHFVNLFSASSSTYILIFNGGFAFWSRWFCLEPSDLLHVSASVCLTQWFEFHTSSDALVSAVKRIRSLSEKPTLTHSSILPFCFSLNVLQKPEHAQRHSCLSS